MKVFTKLATLAVVVAMGLAACGGAQAQVLPSTYKASNSNVFGTANVRSIDKAPGIVALIYSNGQPSYSDFTDNGGVYAKVIADVGNGWVRVGTTDRYINPDQVQRVFCNSNYTTIVYVVGSSENFTGDGCALHSAFLARAK